VDVRSWACQQAVCWCVCVGVGIGGKDGPALFDVGVAACYCQTLVFWCRSVVAPGLPQERLSDSEWGFGREAVPLCAAVARLKSHMPTHKPVEKMQAVPVPLLKYDDNPQGQGP
jgi:hypothetical protein